MTDPRETLSHIRKQAAATEGPWCYQRGYDTPSMWHDACVLDADGESVVSEAYDANAEFIAHSRQDVPALVAALRAVLDLHAERPYGCAVCEEMDQVLSWPCPTVETIRQHLTLDTP